MRSIDATDNSPEILLHIIYGYIFITYAKLNVVTGKKRDFLISCVNLRNGIE